MLDKKIINRIVWIVVIIAVAMIVINTIIEVRYDIRDKRYEKEQQNILERALTEMNATLCRDYIKRPLNCAVLIGQLKNDSNICEDFYIETEEDYIMDVATCKAIITNNLSACNSTEVGKYWRPYCEGYVKEFNLEAQHE